MNLIPSTTAGFTLNFPNPLSNYKEIVMTFRQDGVNKLEKRKADMAIDGNVATFHMTQEESAAFRGGGNIEYQIKAMDTAGNVAATMVKHISTAAILNPETLE